jgi:hypothetical protein
MSKELKDIAKALLNFEEKYKGKATIHCSVMGFKGKDFDVVDDRCFVFGIKESLLLDLKEMEKAIKKEKEEFIFW